MKIIQIAPIVEFQYDEHANKSIANESATIYGLGNDNKLYAWGVTKSERIENKTEEELHEHDYEKYYYNRTYRWIEQ